MGRAIGPFSHERQSENSISLFFLVLRETHKSLFRKVGESSPDQSTGPLGYEGRTDDGMHFSVELIK